MILASEVSRIVPHHLRLQQHARKDGRASIISHQSQRLIQVSQSERTDLGVWVDQTIIISRRRRNGRNVYQKYIPRTTLILIHLENYSTKEIEERQAKARQEQIQE